MSATNSTTHYNLPSFLGSDKPAWLVDWNGAMAAIDSAIYEAKQAADTAGTSASAVASDLATLSGTVSTQGSTISTLSDTLTTAVGNINTINGNINTINSLIGNGTPTTTDQTIIGAINEINANVGNISTNFTNYDYSNGVEIDATSTSDTEVSYTPTSNGIIIVDAQVNCGAYGKIMVNNNYVAGWQPGGKTTDNAVARILLTIPIKANEVFKFTADYGSLQSVRIGRFFAKS